MQHLLMPPRRVGYPDPRI